MCSSDLFSSKATGQHFPGLGQVIGVDVPYEENPAAECVVDAEHLSVEGGRDVVLAFLERWEEEGFRRPGA